MSDIVDLYKEDVRRMVGEMLASLSRWDEVASGGSARKDLRRLSHQLRGSGRTYGFANVTRLSKAIESLIQRIEKNNVPPDERAREAIRQKVERLAAIFSSGDAPANPPGCGGGAVGLGRKGS